MLYDELKEMIRSLGMEGKLTKENLIEIVEQIAENVKKEEYTINENNIEKVIDKARQEGKEQLIENISKVYEYQIMFDDSIGSRCATINMGNGRIDVFFTEMEIYIVKDTLEIDLRKDKESVGQLVISKENKVEFDKEDWILKVA